jgi:ABC-type phosphate transport system permease subunit
VSRRDWLRAMRRELSETSGRGSLSWLVGMAWVATLALVPFAVATGVVVGVVGGTFGNHEVFLEVERSGSDSWIGALLLTVPTAIVGLVAAALVVSRRRAGMAAAYAFAALVGVSAVLSVTNSPPVRQFMDDWQRVTPDPRAADHAEELRINSAIGAVAAATALLVVARRRRSRARS